jgi:hypothetical protein
MQEFADHEKLQFVSTTDLLWNTGPGSASSYRPDCLRMNLVAQRQFQRRQIALPNFFDVLLIKLGVPRFLAIPLDPITVGGIPQIVALGSGLEMLRVHAQPGVAFMADDRAVIALTVLRDITVSNDPTDAMNIRHHTAGTHLTVALVGFTACPEPAIVGPGLLYPLPEVDFILVCNDNRC